MQHLRRCALKNSRGGGLNVDPSASFLTANGVPIPENLPTSECYAPERPGFLTMAGNPDLAQVAMAGGRSYASTHRSASRLRRRQEAAGGKYKKRRSTRKRGGACGCAFAGRGGSRKSRKAQRKAQRKDRKTRKQRAGGCGCAMTRGGSHKNRKAQRKTRKQRGGNKGGYEVDVSMSVGGDGPVAAPVYARIPCDTQAGSSGPFYTPLPQDPRAPANLYSATANQTGGATSGAPGSEIPVYPAETAGFRFAPSTAGGATLPDGVTAYSEVVPYDARM